LDIGNISQYLAVLVLLSDIFIDCDAQ